MPGDRPQGSSRMKRRQDRRASRPSNHRPQGFAPRKLAGGQAAGRQPSQTHRGRAIRRHPSDGGRGVGRRDHNRSSRYRKEKAGAQCACLTTPWLKPPMPCPSQSCGSRAVERHPLELKTATLLGDIGTRVARYHRRHITGPLPRGPFDKASHPAQPLHIPPCGTTKAKRGDTDGLPDPDSQLLVRPGMEEKAAA